MNCEIAGTSIFPSTDLMKLSVLSFGPSLLSLGGVAIDDGADGEVRRCAAGLTFGMHIGVNQRADGPAGHGGVVTAGGAAG